MSTGSCAIGFPAAYSSEWSVRTGVWLMRSGGPSNGGKTGPGSRRLQPGSGEEGGWRGEVDCLFVAHGLRIKGDGDKIHGLIEREAIGR